MKSYAEFYTKKLYPLQNGIIALIHSLNTPFYLTGGTALSRGYYEHRFSDDLDFFVNENPNFEGLMKTILSELKSYCQTSGIDFLSGKATFSDRHAQLFIQKNDSLLKIDFVNDIVVHFGGTHENPELGRIDSVRNILSNKITALFRYEPKDIADIWIIAKNYHFDWNTIFDEAHEKELGIDNLIAAEIIHSIPSEHLNYIKWLHDFDTSLIKSDLDIMVGDMISGFQNSLCTTKP